MRPSMFFSITSATLRTRAASSAVQPTYVCKSRKRSTRLDGIRASLAAACKTRGSIVAGRQSDAEFVFCRGGSIIGPSVVLMSLVQELVFLTFVLHEPLIEFVAACLK